MMSKFLPLLAAVAVRADTYLDASLEDVQSDPRLFLTNFTSNLVAVNTTILAYGLLALAVVGGAIALLITFLPALLQSTDQSGSYGYGDQYNQYSQYARSNDQSFNFNNVNVLQWISTLQEIYEKFDYNDLECQKKLICEVMKEPQTYGPMAKSLKQGFQLAHFIPEGLPEDMRELIDEYLDANERSDQQKECEEFFPCPFSISETVKRNLSGNDL